MMDDDDMIEMGVCLCLFVCLSVILFDRIDKQHDGFISYPRLISNPGNLFKILDPQLI